MSENTSQCAVYPQGVKLLANFSVLGANDTRFPPQGGSDGLYERFLDNTHRFVGVPQVFDQGMKFFETLFAISGSNHNFSRKKAMLNRVPRHSVFPSLGFRSGGAKRVSSVGQDLAFRCGSLARMIFCWSG